MTWWSLWHTGTGSGETTVIVSGELSAHIEAVELAGTIENVELVGVIESDELSAVLETVELIGNIMEDGLEAFID